MNVLNWSICGIEDSAWESRMLCFPLGNSTAAVHTTAVWHSCLLTFLWKCPGYLDGTAPLPGAASSPLSRCVSSPLVEGTYDQHVIQWDESCMLRDLQLPLPSVVTEWIMLVGFYKRNVMLLGAPVQIVKHKSQLDTPVKKIPDFCHRWWSPWIILLYTYQWKMEYLVIDAVYSRGTFLKYVK